MKALIKHNGRGRAHRGMNATRITALSYGGVILLGALLLTLPVMSQDGESAGLLTGLFTATSATCVTGLALEDTLTYWTIGGKIVILILIQLGGLGFMTVSALMLTLFRQEIVLSQRMVMASTLGLKDVGGVVRLVRHALMGTLLVEGTGAILLSGFFVPRYGLLRGIWCGVFHSVSAFCNAGFDLMGPEGGGSLATLSGEPAVLLIHAALIAIGGLGFFVWEDLYNARCWKKLSLYSKMVLVTTAALILSGCLYFLLAEWHNPETLGGMSVGDKIANSLFQSVTLRTAGFASFAQGGMQESSLVMCLLYMLVGGSSGSTAGGIKTVTALVMAASLWTGLRGRETVTIRGRTIPEHQVRNAMTLTLTVILVLFVSAMTLSFLEDIGFLPLLFEVVSAMGTVGLSTGITSSLSVGSDLILIGLMYMGRVGMLSFSLAFLIGRTKVDKVRYPTCDVMIG